MSGIDDEVLRAMLAERADRVAAGTAGEVMAHVRAEVRGPRQGAAFSVLPVLTGRSPAFGAGWAAAAMIAVLVLAVVATRPPAASPSPASTGGASAASSSSAALPASSATPGPTAAPGHVSPAQLRQALAAHALDGRLLLVDSTLRLDTTVRHCPNGGCSPEYDLDLLGPVVTDAQPGQPIAPAQPEVGSTPLSGTFVVVPDLGALILAGRLEGSLASPIALSTLAGYQPSDPGAAVALQAIGGVLFRNSTAQCATAACGPRDFITRAGPGTATNAVDVTVATPALGIESSAAEVAGPFLVRTGTGQRLEVVGRYDIGAYSLVDFPSDGSASPGP